MKKNLVTSAFLLIIAGLITRLLGFVYRIYMTNIIGSEGMGLYQLIVPISTMAWSITCSGFTTTISKLTSAENTKGSSGNVRRFLKQAVLITTGLSFLLGFILFYIAPFISATIFNEPRILLSLRILAFGIPFMAAGSCIRGYFLGMHDSRIPAISQVLEQVVRMFVIYMVSTTFMTRGLEIAVAAAVVAGIAGEIVSLVYTFCAYKDYNHGYKKVFTYSNAESLKILVSLSIPLSMSRVSGSLLSTIENTLIPRQLIRFGMDSSAALSEFGKLTGMAMPLVQLPSVVLMALSISLVPAISENLERKNYKLIHLTVSKTILFATVIGIGAGGGFIMFADRLGTLIYNQDLGSILVYVGVVSPFLYTNMLLTGVLNGLGKQVLIFRNSLISSVISISSILIFIPRIGIVGYIVGWFISLSLLCTLNLHVIKKMVGMRIDLFSWVFKPICALVGAGLFVYLTRGWMADLMGMRMGTVVSAVSMGVVYLMGVVGSGCLKVDDFRTLIKG